MRVESHPTRPANPRNETVNKARVVSAHMDMLLPGDGVVEALVPVPSQPHVRMRDAPAPQRWARSPGKAPTSMHTRPPPPPPPARGGGFHASGPWRGKRYTWLCLFNNERTPPHPRPPRMLTDCPPHNRSRPNGRCPPARTTRKAQARSPQKERSAVMVPVRTST